MAILTVLTLNFFVGPLGPHDLLALRHLRTTMEAKRDALLKQNAALKDRIAKLRSDDAYQQRLIRQELGYARPDELIYRFADHDARGTH